MGKLAQRIEHAAVFCTGMGYEPRCDRVYRMMLALRGHGLIASSEYSIRRAIRRNTVKPRAWTIPTLRAAAANTTGTDSIVVGYVDDDGWPLSYQKGPMLILKFRPDSDITKETKLMLELLPGFCGWAGRGAAKQAFFKRIP
jgi:hypothetical protein